MLIESPKNTRHKTKNQHKTHWGIYLTLFSVSFVYTLLQQDILLFLEENNIFQWSLQQWFLYDKNPLQFLLFLNAFFLQFAYSKTTAALSVSILSLGSALLWERTLRKTLDRELPAISCIAAFLSILNIPFTEFTIPIIFFLSGLSLFIIFQAPPKIRPYLAALLLALLALGIREYALLTWIFFISLTWKNFQNQGKQTYKQKREYIYTFLIPSVILLLTLFLGYFFKKPYSFFSNPYPFVLLTNQSQRVFSVPMVFFQPSNIGIASNLLSISIIAIAPFLYSITGKTTRKTIGIIGMLLGLTFAIFQYLSTQTFRGFTQVNALLENEEWNKALHYLDKEWNKGPEEIAKLPSFTRSLLCSQTKIALIGSRKATDLIMTYPQPDFPMLFPGNITNRCESYCITSLYQAAGLHSECLHIYFDFVTGRSYSTKNFEGIIRNSLVFSDSLTAAKFIYLIDRTLFRKGLAREYASPQSKTRREIDKESLVYQNEPNHTVYAYFPDKDFTKAYLYRPNDPIIYEYYLTLCLLRKEHATLLENLPKIKKFYPREIPQHIQEALLSNYNYIPARTAYPTSIPGISEQTWIDYWNFIADETAFRTNTLGFERFYQRWKHTYWFYHLYMNPQPQGF